MTLVRWIGFSVAAHPSMAANIAIPQVSVDQTNEQVGALVTDLLAVRCREQTVAAYAEDGDVAIENAFKVLGEVAMAEAMMDASVAGRMNGFLNHLDADRLNPLFE